MEWGPIDGQYTADVLPWSIGGVRPDAVVTLNGDATPTDPCGAWGQWTNMHCWDFGYTDEGVYQYPLSHGANTLAYRAEFEDGTSMEFAIDVVYDPTLTSSEGFLVDIKQGDPAQAVVWIVDMQTGPDDGLDITGEPRQEALPIADDAAFIILECDTPGNRPERARTSEEMLVLIEEVRAGTSSTCLFWGRLLAADTMDEGVPSTFLITPDGELQQMEQWWMP